LYLNFVSNDQNQNYKRVTNVEIAIVCNRISYYRDVYSFMWCNI